VSNIVKKFNYENCLSQQDKRATRTLGGIVAVDLFCGAGGLTRGLENVGIKVALGIDIDPACEYAYAANNAAEFLLKSVKELSPAELLKAYGNAKYTILAGCAPCQPFSKYRLGKSNESDGRWNLLQEFQRLVFEVKPTIVTMENVPRLAAQTIFADFIAALEDAGYHVHSEVVNCADYGVPQQRERLVLLASKLGSLKLIPPTHAQKPCTVRQVIANLPPLSAGSEHPDDPLHQTATLAPINLLRIKASKPGGTWRDWASDLVVACHRKPSGKTYPSVYGRMCWDFPAPTMTTQFFGFGNGRFGHPEQDRAISLREGAIIQSFPKAYRFIEPGQPIHIKTIGRLIGNAVPVKLGEAIGRSIRVHIEALDSQDGKNAEPKSSAS